MNHESDPPGPPQENKQIEDRILSSIYFTFEEWKKELLEEADQETDVDYGHQLELYGKAEYLKIVAYQLHKMLAQDANSSNILKQPPLSVTIKEIEANEQEPLNAQIIDTFVRYFASEQLKRKPSSPAGHQVFVYGIEAPFAYHMGLLMEMELEDHPPTKEELERARKKAEKLPEARDFEPPV